MTQKVSGTMLEADALEQLETEFTSGNFIRVAGDGTLTERTPAEVRADIGAGTGSVSSVAVADATGITWTGSPITGSGTLTPTLSANLQAWSGIATSAKQNQDNGLDALAAFNTSAFLVQTSTNVFAGRTLTGTAGRITVTNGAGTAGNPVFDIPTTLIDSGTYTPTLTGVANVSSTTSKLTGYVRLGNMVWQAGQFEVTPTAGATITELRMSLPVATNFSASEQLGGAGHEGGTGQFVSCSFYAVAATDDALVRFRSGAGATVHAFLYTLGYRII